MPRWVNVPNAFTLARLILVPFIVQAILNGRPVLALALFATAALTDVLDGATARRYGAATVTGLYFDPIADKCLLSGVFLALAAAAAMPWWLVAVVFGRDIYILLAAAVLILLTKARRFPPSVWGKISTFVQIVTVSLCLGKNVFPHTFVDSLFSITVWPCAAFTVWSGIHYTWRGIRPLVRIDAISARE